MKVSKRLCPHEFRRACSFGFLSDEILLWVRVPSLTAEKKICCMNFKHWWGHGLIVSWSLIESPNLCSGDALQSSFHSFVHSFILETYIAHLQETTTTQRRSSPVKALDTFVIFKHYAIHTVSYRRPTLDLEMLWTGVTCTSKEQHTM